jgi:hypothetical protein
LTFRTMTGNHFLGWFGQNITHLTTLTRCFDGVINTLAIPPELFFSLQEN